jgi:hypothetical protein
MMKPSLRRSKLIYGTHDLELERGSYVILKILHATKREVSVWETKGFVFYGSYLNLSRYFHRI